MEEENKSNTENMQETPPAPETVLTPEPEPARAPEATAQKPPVDEFSMAWHLKTLAIIYVCLGIFYVLLKIFLK